MSAWLLPDHIADVLPSEARHIEELRRELLDTARAYGYELVIPPLIEHLDSLLTGTGEALNLQTFKLVEPQQKRMSGQTYLGHYPSPLHQSDCRPDPGTAIRQDQYVNAGAQVQDAGNVKPGWQSH